MIPYSLSELAGLLSARLEGPDRTIDTVWIDSRNIIHTKTGVFIALHGVQKDGHEFIEDAYRKGIRAFIVKEVPAGIEDASWLVVEDTVSALQQWAAIHRSRFDLHVMGITGSNGKTIVKEWLNQLLFGNLHIVRSPKSFNSQIGVPLSVLQINPNDELGIFEAGISKPGEMRQLANIIQPQTGILTNIGSAHSEYFKNREQHIQEKLTLFESCQKIVFPGDDAQIAAYIHALPQSKSKNLISWGENQNNTVQLISVKSDARNRQIEFKIAEEIFSIQIPFTDEASTANTLCCAAVLYSMEFGTNEFKSILKRFEFLHAVEMRLEIKEGMYGSTVINDSFNSDLHSVQIALQTLNQKAGNKKTIVLTDILQNRQPASEIYPTIAGWVNEFPVDKVILIGHEISKYQSEFQQFSAAYPNASDFLSKARQEDFAGETVLLKGARSFELERISNWLEKKSHDTVLEVNLHALRENIAYFRTQLQPKTRLMCMVKAFGYGTGATELATALETMGVDYLGVAYADEGAMLRQAGISSAIMVMNPEQSSYSAIIENRLEPEIYSFRVLEKFAAELSGKAISEPYPVHIKLNTGMNRLGFDEKDIPVLKNKLKDFSLLKVVSVFSHNATADMPEEKEFVFEQIRRFEKMYEQLTAGMPVKPIRHILNTEGILNFAENQMDMVRLGIGMYGISANKEHQQYLKNVVTFKTVISQIRTLQQGDTVSYGRRFRAEKEMRIATLPVGYADGIRRLLGNGVGKVNIGGKTAPILGTVCMDMMMVDVTEIACSEGDEVIIFGENPRIEDLAVQAGTIPYEILTSISARVKRVYVSE